MPHTTSSYSALAIPAFALAGGAGIFGAFIVLYLLAVTYSLYNQRGSGISQRPYSSRYGDAPAARGASRMSGRDRPMSSLWRGTR